MEDSDAWRSLVSDAVFDSSKTRFGGSGEQHYWEIEIMSTAECNVMIGVCRPDVLRRHTELRVAQFSQLPPEWKFPLTLAPGP